MYLINPIWTRPGFKPDSKPKELVELQNVEVMNCYQDDIARSMCICPFVVLQAVLKTTFKATHSFLFFCSFLLKIRPKCSAYSTPSSSVVSSPCWWNDHRPLCCLTFIIFLYLSFAVGKLGDLCTRQCDGCNIKGTVLPLRQPRRRHSAIAAAAASASPSPPFGSGVAVATTAVTAITVQSLLAVAQRERGSF